MPETRDVVIDCDPGIDDALALMLAAGSPAELHLLGVTCVAGNRPVELTARNARRVLDAAGCAAVPVYAGCARPIAHAQPRCNLVHGGDGLGGIDLPEGRPPEPLHAVDFLARTLLQAPARTLTMIAVGPLTNLAVVEVMHPGALGRARQVLVMGGAAFRRGNITPYAEFNFYADPVAAHVVLGSGALLGVFGLDVTQQAAMSPSWIASFAAQGSRCAGAAHAMLAVYGAKEPLLHDACPVAYAIDPTLFHGERHELSVDWQAGPAEGHLLAVPPAAGQGGNALLLTRVDSSRLLSLVHERVCSLP